MTKKKNKNKSTFNSIIKEITAKDLEEDKLSIEDVEKQKEDYKIYKYQNLAFNFKYLTENKKYNFQAFNDDKSSFEGFTTRLNNTLKKLSTFQVKDLYNPPFKDKFNYSNLFQGTYVSSQKQFTGTEQLISVEFSNKSKERIILFYENNEYDGHNILYVLGFDLKHNMYKH